MQLHGGTCVSAVKAALRSGVRLFDTASAYGSEEEVKGFLSQVTSKPALVQNEIHPCYQESGVILHTAQDWYPLGGRGHPCRLRRSDFWGEADHN